MKMYELQHLMEESLADMTDEEKNEFFKDPDRDQEVTPEQLKTMTAELEKDSHGNSTEILTVMLERSNAENG
jgi:hypothetical protein